MSEEEVDIVAEELAKLGGTAWYPGRERGPILRVVHERYRDRARAAIAALDRFRARGTDSGSAIDIPPKKQTDPSSDDGIRLGATIVYRPPGDRRAYPCTVKKIRNGFAYLVPEDRTGISWVPIAELAGMEGGHDFQTDGGGEQDRAHDV